jgi:TRAP-type C4-dicarboxylate transport system substrate-binding protein
MTPRTHRRIPQGARRLAVATLGAVLAACAATPPVPEVKPVVPIELKLSVAVGPAYALGKAGEGWASRISERSGGRLRVKLFPGASLAHRNAEREFVALKEGFADLAIGSTLDWSAQVPALGVVGLPWLAAGPGRLEALLSGPVADALDAAVARSGAMPLALAPLGYRALATTGREVRTPADVVGLRIRIIAPAPVSQFYAALGAQPQTTSFATAQAAFAAGTLDAQDGSLATFAASHVYAIGLKRVLLWDAIAEGAVFAVNRARWESLPDADRALLRASAREVAGELAALVRQEADAALADLHRGKMTVERLTPAGTATFAAATRALYAQRAAALDPALVRAAEAAVAAVPATPPPAPAKP